MTSVVAIHGISQQQGGRNQLLLAWEPALRDGVERAVGREALDKLDVSVDLAFYGDVFLTPAVMADKGPAGAGALTADDVAFFEEVQEDLAADAEPPAPTMRDKGIKEVPPSLAKLATWLDRRFGAAGPALFFGDLKQVRHYQRDDRLAETVRGRAVEMLGKSVDVVVAHSLGSVVAYETLCLTEGHNVTTLVTLGSPLGLPSVQRRLRCPPDPLGPDLPPGVTTWINIYDRNDPVACAGGLHGTWSNAADVIVDNGNTPHAVVRYLGKEPTGQAIAGAAATVP